ncbi:MAG: DUF1292 domain-containing protein [Clostridium fessum]
MECVVLTIFPAGGKDYIALLPMDDIEAEDGEVYLYRYSEDENGQPNCENIEDDDEYEIVADAFDELLDEQEYDELVGEDEAGSVIRQAKDRTLRYFAGRNGEASGRFTSFRGGTMELKQELKLKQTLSQKMIQSANILQMGQIELKEYIEEMALENPVVDLEEREPENGRLEENGELNEKIRRLEELASLDRQNQTYYQDEEEERGD